MLIASSLKRLSISCGKQGDYTMESMMREYFLLKMCSSRLKRLANSFIFFSSLSLS